MELVMVVQMVFYLTGFPLRLAWC